MDSADGGWGVRLSANTGIAGAGAGAPLGGGLTGGPISTLSNGNAGGKYGGGGSGAFSYGAVKTGGAGSNGLIRVWEYA